MIGWKRGKPRSRLSFADRWRSPLDLLIPGRTAQWGSDGALHVNGFDDATRHRRTGLAQSRPPEGDQGPGTTGGPFGLALTDKPQAGPGRPSDSRPLVIEGDW